MNQRTPTLRKHVRGMWFCRWGGKDHYFGSDRTAAQELYLQSLSEWAQWRSSRNAQRLPPMREAVSVAELSKKFLDWKEQQGGTNLRAYYNKHIGRFVAAFSHLRADMIRAAHLQAIKSDMLAAHYAPKTVNHDTVAIKAMLDWASGLEMIPAVALRGVKTLPLGPPKHRAIGLDGVRRMIRTAPDKLKPWLAINYLCLMRPTEVVRVVHRQGQWVEKGVFRLDRGKMDQRVSVARHICFSREAFSWLRRAETFWARLDTYSAAVRRECGPGGPHPLRHSGATHLLQQGVARADIDLLLGHSPGRVSVTYAPIAWQPLRELVARITLAPISVLRP